MVELVTDSPDGPCERNISAGRGHAVRTKDGEVPDQWPTVRLAGPLKICSAAGFQTERCRFIGHHHAPSAMLLSTD